MMGARRINLLLVPVGQPANGGGTYAGGTYAGGQMGGSGGTSTSLKLRGMPWAATADDIVAFFHGYGPVAKEMVSLGPNPGQATVHFPSPQEAARAFAERNNQHMGSRYIELFAQ
jgi:hypothetical protein